MAVASETPKQGNVVPHKGDHDRVAMLSVRADGTLDQHNPEIIGDKEFALAATKEQFKQQAVSAVDVAERGVSSGSEDEGVQDPSVAALKEKHDAAAETADKTAEKVVNSLYQG